MSENRAMSEEHLISLHQPWANRKNEDGSQRVTDTHGKRAFHPYTRLDFKNLAKPQTEKILCNL